MSFKNKGLKTAKTVNEKMKLISNFEKAFDMFGHPMMREFMGKSDDMYFFYKEGRHMVRSFLERFYGDDKNKE